MSRKSAIPPLWATLEAIRAVCPDEWASAAAKGATAEAEWQTGYPLDGHYAGATDRRCAGMLIAAANYSSAQRRDTEAAALLRLAATHLDRAAIDEAAECAASAEAR